MCRRLSLLTFFWISCPGGHWSSDVVPPCQFSLAGAVWSLRFFHTPDAHSILGFPHFFLTPQLLQQIVFPPIFEVGGVYGLACFLLPSPTWTSRVLPVLTGDPTPSPQWFSSLLFHWTFFQATFSVIDLYCHMRFFLVVMIFSNAPLLEFPSPQPWPCPPHVLSPLKTHFPGVSIPAFSLANPPGLHLRVKRSPLLYSSQFFFHETAIFCPKAAHPALGIVPSFTHFSQYFRLFSVIFMIGLLLLSVPLLGHPLKTLFRST